MIRWFAETAPPSSAVSAVRLLNPLTSWLLAKQAPSRTPGNRSGARSPQTSAPAPVTISGRWLARAFLAVIAVAALCTYGTLCLLFYQGEWQMVLHPSRTVTITPASQNIRFDEIHFDFTETGAPKLYGWWIPADPGSHWGSSAVLYLHGAEGSLSNTVPDLAALHSLGINVFAFDYRGFGRSAGIRPGERRMIEDTTAAWQYLTQTRHLDPKSIVIYGSGVGASLAAELAAQHNPAGIVLSGPSEPARQIIAQDARSKILPLWLLLTEQFDPTEALRSSASPKLFLDRDGAKARTGQLYQAAALPKEYFELKQSGYESTLRRFFDQVLL
jgi:pimeloyl-ACP methyl ester carboxylesterase